MGSPLSQLAVASPTVRLVATIGLYVAIPAAARLIFGPDPTLNVVGLTGTSSVTFDIFGVVLTISDVMIMAVAAVVGLGLALLLEFTTFGLLTRAVVDSSVTSRLVGINPTVVSSATWVLGTALAGLAGILLAPIIGLDSSAFNALLLAAFAAVVFARMTSLSLAFAGGIVVGLIEDIASKYIPASNVALAGIVPSIPFILILVFLLLARGNEATLHGARTVTTGKERIEQQLSLATTRTPTRRSHYLKVGSWGLIIGIVVPLVVSEFWLSLLGEGVVLAIIFLSFTLLSGNAGVIPLAQSTLAGVGAITVGSLPRYITGQWLLLFSRADSWRLSWVL